MYRHSKLIEKIWVQFLGLLGLNKFTVCTYIVKVQMLNTSICLCLFNYHKLINILARKFWQIIWQRIFFFVSHNIICLIFLRNKNPRFTSWSKFIFKCQRYIYWIKGHHCPGILYQGSFCPRSFFRFIFAPEVYMNYHIFP